MRHRYPLFAGFAFLMILPGCGPSASYKAKAEKTVITKPFLVKSSGKSWHFSPSGTIPSLFQTQFFTSHRGIAVGSMGQSDGIFTTTSGGQHWRLVYMRPAIFRVSMFSAQQGWLVTCANQGCEIPNELMATANGGTTWHVLYQAPAHVSLSTPDFVSPTTGYMLATNQNTHGTRLMRTTDKGLQWSYVPAPINFPGNLGSALDFITPKTGWLLSGGEPSAGYQSKTLYQTRNGGQTWQPVTSTGSLSSSSLTQNRLLAGGYIDGLDFLTPSWGYVPLSRGPILVTHDGGRHFTPQWTKTFSPGNATILSLSFLSPATGFILSEYPGLTSLWRTYNGGASWSSVYPPPAPNGPMSFTPHERLGAGIDTWGSHIRILLTTNGGSSWTIDKAAPKVMAYPLWGPGRILWLLGQNGQLWQGQNQGRQFTSIPSPSYGQLRSLAIAAKTATVLAVVSTPSGNTMPVRLTHPFSPRSHTWQTLNWPFAPKWISTPSAHTIWALGVSKQGEQSLARDIQDHPHNPKAVGQYQSRHPLPWALYHTDGNGHWTRYVLPNTVTRPIDPSGPVFLSPKWGYFWTSQRLYVTANGGRSWSVVLTTRPQDTLSWVDFVSSAKAWITFDNGSIALLHH